MQKTQVFCLNQLPTSLSVLRLDPLIFFRKLGITGLVLTYTKINFRTEQIFKMFLKRKGDFFPVLKKIGMKVLRGKGGGVYLHKISQNIFCVSMEVFFYAVILRAPVIL